MSEASEKDRNDASRAESILQFWFAPESDADEGQTRSRWFVPDLEFDRECTTRFLGDHEDAARGHLDDWKNAPRSCLALILLLDQLPRNMFRNTQRAFATDAKAREISRHAVAAGFDRELPPVMRMFVYLPLEHSENLADQLESVQLARALVKEDPGRAGVLRYAEQHLQTIQRFGRFPARNVILGRESTREELEFLANRKW